MDLKSLLPTAIEAATAASREILAVYNSADFQAEVKGDNSPLTLADKRAHEKISELLTPTNLPLLSEEGADVAYAARRGWEYFWMVDPLDGTKEFIKRNGEFTVNIALIHKGAPVLGVVAVPVTGDVFYAAKGLGAWLKKNGQEVPLKKRAPVKLDQPGLRVVASRSHMNEETQNFIDKLKNPVLVSKGSSLKFMLVAEGHADLYPRYAPTMEWDTAAAHAVVLETGAQVLQAGTNEALIYNKENLLNPFFLVL
ncbi:3'(2'),5'-bisphosphate nucleotidase CysQ [Fulvivirgaceae bacterium PWU4]|uniref:3'(2'),5'-bisphosphate nucleotidase CysQ n=1 Tax=Chryseosolibacter histidini TaxID=2782349 RepID=A0AAP2DTX6_9BACT|nr:3'(2'),5'-bisphosphate nucleotidase CysQ [Chryseosolibacter histidini]MBT1700544.1 3'(2'),5'-bisphosphate nucleotidase CysQ [Chryseosolibacter histidini]